MGDTAKAILDEEVLITGFGYTVMPGGTARLGVQVFAAHTRNHLCQVVKAFETI